MGKLQEFLLARELENDKGVEVTIAPFPFPFIIRALSQEENKAIRKSCQKTIYDKKTRQKNVELDTDAYNARLVIASCIEPNFKDADLQKKYGVMGAEQLLDKIFKPGEFYDLLLAVQEINGFMADMNELREEAKNSLPVETEE